MNTIEIPDHKHCVYCGKADNGNSIFCLSPNNRLVVDGVKYHVYLS